MKLQITMSNGYAFAKAEYIDEKVRLIKGSTIERRPSQSDVDKAKSTKTKEFKDKLRRERVEYLQSNKLVEVDNNLYELKEDITLNTPSSAASFVTGVSTNGQEIWQVYDENKEAPVSLNHYRMSRDLPKYRESNKSIFSAKVIKKAMTELVLYFQDKQEIIPNEVIMCSISGTKHQMIDILKKYSWMEKINAGE